MSELNKHIEDYPTLDKWLDDITQAEDERWCFREDVEEKLLEMQNKIEQLEQENAELKAIISAVCDRAAEQLKKPKD